MARLTQADWKRLRQMLQPFKHFNGIPPLLAKIEDNIVEGGSAYIKVVRLEFLPNGGPPPLDDPLSPLPPTPRDPAKVAEYTALTDSETIRRLMSFGCRVVSQAPPGYVIRVPHDGDDFDNTIDLLETLHGAGRIRYER